MNLSLLVILPLITALALLPFKQLKQVRLIAFIGATAQFILCFVLLFLFWKERSSGNTGIMLFENNYTWYAPLHINYHTGVDGISISMIMLTAFVILAGVLVSWKMPGLTSGGDKLSKEFFFLLLFLKICID